MNPAMSKGMAPCNCGNHTLQIKIGAVYCPDCHTLGMQGRNVKESIKLWKMAQLIS